MRRAIPAAATLLAVAAALTGGIHLRERYWPKHLSIPSHQHLPSLQMHAGSIALHVPGRQLIADVGQYSDELFAYLMFDYLRSRLALDDVEVLLTYFLEDDTISYHIQVVLPDDLIRGLSRLNGLSAGFPFLTTDWFFYDDRLLRDLRFQTRTFVSAYNFPAYRSLERLPLKEVEAYARRFIRFKSATDPRVRRQIEPVPRVLTSEEAQQLAQDIVSVARFYNLPLDLFLGIGAMENNYMNIKGDLGNAIWKPRPSKGDVILRCAGGRVLVLNESAGVWQITRETLRVAHSIYLKDQRDYSKLPGQLRPPHDLDLAAIEPPVLTTYAGLLFRDLLDRFDGDVIKAVGAYNGGPGNPNRRYAEGVQRAADHARKVLEQAAALRGKRVIERQFLRAPYGH